MKLVIIGTGYVGLVTGACLADVGHTVVCIDKDNTKIERLKKGQIPIYEPELDDLVQHNCASERLSFSTDLTLAIIGADVLFLAVGTPPKADHSADLSAVVEASKQIGQLLTQPLLVVTKSTVPVGTAQLVRETIQKYNRHDIPFEVASNPEFLREGAAVKDFMEPDRIVIGIATASAEESLREVYKPLLQNNVPLVVTDTRSAEVIKYASNSFLALKISFINEIANLCEVTGATIDHVATGMGLDSRIGQKYLHAGLGYGGSCFPKDIKALVATGKQFKSPLRLLEVVDDVNQKQPLRIIAKLKKHLGPLKGRQIAIWGLAFKARTDDTREAPSLVIIKALQAHGATIRAYDPVVKSLSLTITHSRSAVAACQKADALVIVTEWEDFLYPDFVKLKAIMTTPLIVDGRNIYDPEHMKESGFMYDSIGRPL